MSRYFLKKIRIEGFRGINNEGDPLELCFHTNAVNSIFAINGTGKSSIYEALCYAIKGNVPKLKKLRRQERPEDYVCNIFHSQGCATIELEFECDVKSVSNETITITRQEDGTRAINSPTGCSDPANFLKKLDEDFTLLDYTTFSRFIDSSPLERGRSFSALLGLSKYSDLRQTFQAVTDPRVLNNDFKLTVREDYIQTQETAIKELLRILQYNYEKLIGTQIADIGQIDNCETDILEAMGRIQLINSHITGNVQLDTIDFEEIKNTIKSAEGGEKRQELQNMIEKVSELETLKDSASQSFDLEQQAIIKLVEEKSNLLSKTNGDTYKNLYEIAHTLIVKGELEDENVCPLCESTLEAPIRQIIDNQLEQYAQVSKISDEILQLWNTSEWTRELKNYEDAKSLELDPKNKISGACSLKAKQHTLILEDIKQASELLNALDTKRNEELESAQKKKKEIEEGIPSSLVVLTEQVQYCNQFSYALQEYRKKVKILEELKAQLKLRQKWRDFIIKAAATYFLAEAKLSRKKVSDIHDSFHDLFKKVINVSDIVPELERPSQNEELHVNLSNFHGQSGVSARAILSESYRNALAISVFFSAALKHKGNSRFMVLDDITSSFDSGHQWNLMEVIRTNLQYFANSDGVQVILLSHDGLLEKYFDKLGNTVDWNHQKLQGWPPMGAVLSQNQDAGRLKANAIRFLDAGQVKEAEPLIRQYLEFKLLQIINKVSIPVPLDFSIKDHMKMVSNALKAIQKDVNLHRDAGCLILEQTQIQDLEKIHIPTLVGNWVIHYETAVSSSIAPPVLKKVLDIIDDFSECFRYDDNSSGITQRKWYRDLSSK